MAARAARLLHPMRRAANARALFRGLHRRDVVQQSATVEGFKGGRRKAAHAGGKPLQGELGSSACSSTRTERSTRHSSQSRNKPTGPTPTITRSQITDKITPGILNRDDTTKTHGSVGENPDALLAPSGRPTSNRSRSKPDRPPPAPTGFAR